MDQKLKERLLGAVIILSVLIFFLPMLFKQNNGNNENLSRATQSMENTAALEDQLKELELEKQQLIHPISAVPKVVPKVVPKESGKTWVLRMGIFSNPNNAKLLVENLSAKGYQAYSQVDMSKGAKITRVFVGPKKSEFEIKEIRDQIKHDLKMQGIVLYIKYPERGAT